MNRPITYGYMLVAEGLQSSGRGDNRMKFQNKRYWRLPWGLGEIQYGTISRSLVVWWRGSRYILLTGRTRSDRV